MNAQVIKIVDQQTNSPIENVVVYNLQEDIFVKSNLKGEVNLSVFNQEDLLNFQHPSYQSIILPFQAAVNAEVIQMYEHILEMDEVVVSASKWEQSSKEIANSITSISSKQIEFNMPQTSADLLEQSGKVFVQKSQFGGGSPMIRGFSANSVLIIVDGLRMNNAIFRSGNLQNIINIDPMSVENAEVIFGPGSVMYGSDALGGVMDFHTKKNTFSKQTKWKANALLRYATASNERTSHLNVTRSGKKVSWFSSITLSSLGDLRAGGNYSKADPDFGKRTEYVRRENGTDVIVQNPHEEVQVGSGFNLFNMVNKLTFNLSEEKNLEYGFYYSSTSNIPRYDRLIQYRNGELRYGDWYYGPQKWLRNSLTLNSSKKTKLFDEAKYIVGHQKFIESRHSRDIYSNDLVSRIETVNSFHLNMDYHKDITERKSIFYGLESFLNTVGSEAFSEDLLSKQTVKAPSRYPSEGSNYSTLAGYFSYKSRIRDQWILQYGGRMSYIHLSSDFSDKTFYAFPFDKLEIKEPSFTGNAGLVWLPPNGWKLNLLTSTGFRAPNVDDAGKLFDSEPGNVIVPNDNLNSEYVYNIDLGISRTFGNSLKLESTFFYSWIEDVIVRRDFLFNGQDSIVYDGVKSKVQALTNAESGIVMGTSLSLKAEFGKYWAIVSHLTITEGQDSDGFALRHAAPTYGITSLQFKKGKINAELFTRYNGAIAFEDLAPSEQSKIHLYSSEGALAWATLNFRFHYNLSNSMLMNLALENLFDKHYRTYSSGISSPGINGILSFTLTF